MGFVYFALDPKKSLAYKEQKQDHLSSLIYVRLHHSGISTFTKTVSGSAATALLNDIQSLKPVPGDANAAYNCPSDDGITGITYTFAFRNPGLNATAAASSCEWVTISGKTYLSTDKFWHDVTKATGQSI